MYEKLITNSYTCESCGLCFSIIVEPSYDSETVKREFQDSYAFYANDSKAVTCPKCGEVAEVD